MASSGRAASGGDGARSALAGTARQAKGPAAAAGAAVGGLAVGAALGTRLRAHRRPHLMGLPLPRSSEVRAGAARVARAGRRLYELEREVRLLREEADASRRQSPVEVVLSALTSRRLPRRT